MNEPVTTLDARFSDPDAIATRWDETRQLLETAELFWITTVRADGRPHVTPLVAVWLDDALHFSTGDAEQKGVNLAGNRHVILTTGCNDWDQGVDVVVEGDAIQVTDEGKLKRLARGVGHQVGRSMAIRGAQRQLLRPRRRCGPRLLGGADQDPRLRQGQLQPHTTPVLTRTPLVHGRRLVTELRQESARRAGSQPQWPRRRWRHRQS